MKETSCRCNTSDLGRWAYERAKALEGKRRPAAAFVEDAALSTLDVGPLRECPSQRTRSVLTVVIPSPLEMPDLISACQRERCELDAFSHSRILLRHLSPFANILRDLGFKTIQGAEMR